MAFSLRRLALDDMDAAARIHRIAFDERLPWLAGLHTPAEDRAFYRERVFPRCELWGAAAGGDIVGIIAFRDGWVDQLYVRPERQGCGAGGALLAVAQAAWPALQLYAFQRNTPARRFYEKRGFIMVRESDGSTNDEREPDVLYRWERSERG